MQISFTGRTNAISRDIDQLRTKLTRVGSTGGAMIRLDASYVDRQVRDLKHIMSNQLDVMDRMARRLYR